MDSLTRLQDIQVVAVNLKREKLNFFVFFGLSKFLRQMFFASPVPKKKTWEATRELYQERLRENHEVIGDNGRYNHADVAT